MDGEPRRSARIAQRRLNLVEPAVMANPVVLRNPVQLMPLVVGQQAVNDGLAEGGLAQVGSLHSAKHCGPIGTRCSSIIESVLQTSSNAT